MSFHIYPTHPLPNILRLFLRLISNTVINRLFSIEACLYSSVLLPDILHTMSKPILPQSSSRRYRTPPLNHYVFENEACLSSVTAVETSLSSSLLFLTNVPHIVLKPSARREAIYIYGCDHPRQYFPTHSWWMFSPSRRVYLTPGTKSLGNPFYHGPFDNVHIINANAYNCHIYE